jgi:hypothetical protein
MQHAIAAVRAFARKQQLRAFAIERGAPLDQPLDCTRALLYKSADRLLITQSVTCDYRVVFVQLDLVVIAESRGNSALSVLGRRFAQGILRDNEHMSSRGELNCRAQTGNTCPNYDEVCVNV